MSRLSQQLSARSSNMAAKIAALVVLAWFAMDVCEARSSNVRAATTASSSWASASTYHSRLARGRRRGQAHGYANDALPWNDRADTYSATALVSSRKKPTEAAEIKSRSKRAKAPSKEIQKDDRDHEVTLDDLGPIGRVVFGVTNVVFTALIEYVSGFTIGYVIGTVVGVPGLLFKPLSSSKDPRVQLGRQFTSRFQRMNTRSVSWAKGWGGLKCAFGASDALVMVVRGSNGQGDETWNSVFSSAIAGAWFARKDGPQGMLRGALLYGGLIYLLSGNLGGGNSRLLNYEEREVERSSL